MAEKIEGVKRHRWYFAMRTPTGFSSVNVDTRHKFITRSAIKRAEQSVCESYGHKECMLISISYLGEMTKEEWEAE